MLTGFHGIHGAPFNVHFSKITNVILDYIRHPIKHLTYPLTKDKGECSMSEKLKEIYPNLNSAFSELCSYGLSYNIQLAYRALEIRLGRILTYKLKMWTCSIFKGNIIGVIIHYYYY